MLQAVLIACALLGALPTTPVKAPEARRYALLVGSNHGNLGEPVLKYAQDDADGMASVLTSLGGFDARNISVLHDPTNAQVLDAFSRIKHAVSDDAAGGDALLLVYYSGHADALAVHLGGTLLSYKDLLKYSEGVQTSARVVVVDACRSGQATIEKGMKRVAPFLAPQDEESLPAGSAVLASASAGESAQESPKLRGSFFTHFLIAGLRGAADFNADGKVTLTEAFQYSADQTAASTAETITGIQHATYRYQMHGRADLVLSRPSIQNDVAVLTLRDPGEYVLQQDGAEGKVLVETRVAQTSQSAWLPAGRYYVQRRTGNAIWAGVVTMSAHQPRLLLAADLLPMNYPQVATKGEAPEVTAVQAPVAAETPSRNELSVWGGTGAPALAGFAMPGVFTVQGTHYVGRLAVDAQLQFLFDSAHQSKATIQMLDGAALAGARWLFVDDDAWRLSAGVRAGVGYGQQTITFAAGTTSKRACSARGEGIVRAEARLVNHLMLGIEGGVALMTPATQADTVRVTPRVALGLVYAF